MWALFYAIQPSGVERVVLTTALLGSRHERDVRDKPDYLLSS